MIKYVLVFMLISLINMNEIINSNTIQGWGLGGIKPPTSLRSKAYSSFWDEKMKRKEGGRRREEEEEERGDEPPLANLNPLLQNRSLFQAIYPSCLWTGTKDDFCPGLVSPPETKGPILFVPVGGSIRDKRTILSRLVLPTRTKGPST